MASTPTFASVPKIGLATISTANSGRDGSGTLTNVVSAGSSGTKINEIIVEALSTTTSGTVRVFIYDGNNNYLFDEIAVAANVPTASNTTVRYSKIYDNLVLPNNYILKASTHNAESFNIIALGADL